MEVLSNGSEMSWPKSVLNSAQQLSLRWLIAFSPALQLVVLVTIVGLVVPAKFSAVKAQSMAAAAPRTAEERERAVTALLAARAVPAVQAIVSVASRPSFSAIAVIRSVDRTMHRTVQGSGALVDRCHVLTAAHVLVPTGKSDTMVLNFPDEIEIYLGAKPVASDGLAAEVSLEQLAAAFSVHAKGTILMTGVIGMSQDNNTADPPAVDWAVLQLSPCIDSIRPMVLDGGNGAMPPIDTRISFMGFPGAGRLGEITVAEKCPIVLRANNRALIADCRPSGGMSGGPIVIGAIEPGAPIVGVVSESTIDGNPITFLEPAFPARVALEVAAAHKPASRAEIETVQRLLTQAGFRVAVTGLEDRDTRAAIWNFFRSVFLPAANRHVAPLEYRMQTYVTPGVEDALRARLGTTLGFRFAGMSFCGGTRTVTFGLTEDGRHYTMRLDQGAAETIAIKPEIDGMTLQMVPDRRPNTSYTLSIVDDDHAVFESLYDTGNPTQIRWAPTNIGLVMHRC